MELILCWCAPVCANSNGLRPRHACLPPMHSCRCFRVHPSTALLAGHLQDNVGKKKKKGKNVPSLNSLSGFETETPTSATKPNHTSGQGLCPLASTFLQELGVCPHSCCGHGGTESSPTAQSVMSLTPRQVWVPSGLM